jgi:hypothetical protein
LRAGMLGRSNRDLAACGTADHAKVRLGKRTLEFPVHEKEEQLILKDWPTGASPTPARHQWPMRH